MNDHRREIRTRRILNRTRENYRINPTPGRFQAIESYERHLRILEFWRTAEANPNMTVTFRELIEIGILDVRS